MIETLEHAVLDAEIPYVAPEPRPSAVLMEAGGGLSRYALRYWISDPQADDPTDSAVRAHALAALTRQGIRVRMPMEERHIVQDDAVRRTSLNEDETARRLATLSSVYLFKVLSDAERTALIEHLIYAPFLEGSTITRQGAVAHWLYILEVGEAEVWVESTETGSRVNTLSPGSIFGEKGMMTGEPRG